MDSFHLSENHTRSISASLYMVERLLAELEHDLTNSSEMILSHVVYDVEEKEKDHYLGVIRKIRDYLRIITKKYNLTSREVSFSQLLQAKKSGIWVILCDTTSHRLRGYGQFPKEYAEEFDSDISKLQELVQQL